ncbi:MAG: N-acetylneuraminate synthase family protein [Nitrospirota bacterium]|nr:N-acetylneuraminate synthase family protein [Nitrospirota bacterium]
MTAFVIAEIGPNHNGSLEIALEMVKRLALSGADAIKFQLADPEAVYSADAFKAEYQKQNDGAGSVIEMSRRLQLPQDAHRQLQQACVKMDILYLCTAFDLGSLEFLDQALNVPRFKVGSGELLTIDMLEYMAHRQKPVILSTGMANFDEIASSLVVLTSEGLKDITLLHCVSNYPSPHADMNLLAMPELAKQFRCKVGFSDHSLGAESCLAAVALGAQVIEKHVTLDKNMPGPDHNASATIEEFYSMVASIRRVEAALGNAQKTFSATEEGIRRMARKSIVTARDIPAGARIEKADLVFKRPGTGLSPLLRDRVIGTTARRDLAADRVIHLGDIEGIVL